MPSYSALSTACLAAVLLMPHAAAQRPLAIQEAGNAPPTVVYRHEHAQLTHEINQDGLEHYDAPYDVTGKQFTAIDLKTEDPRNHPLDTVTAAGKDAVCSNATIVPARTTKLELNKCIIGPKPDPNCRPATKWNTTQCAVNASMYLMGVNGDPHVIALKSWYYNPSGPLQPACVDQATRPGGVANWYVTKQIGTLGVMGCTVQGSPWDAVGLFNQCQWNLKGEIDQPSKCVRMAEQSSQGSSKCRGANPLSKLAKNMCRTNQHKPCGCFTGVSWSTSANSV